MDIPDACSVLIAELGKDLGLANLAFDDEGKLVLKLGDQRVVMIVVRPEATSFVFYSEICAAAAVNTKLLKRALEGNFAWSRTAGATLALDPKTGALVLHKELAVASIEFSQFIQSIEQFVEIAEAWSTMINHSPSKETESPSESSRSDLAMRLSMRV